MRVNRYLQLSRWGLCLLSLTAFAVPAAALDLRSWDQRIDSGRSRFQVLRSFNNEAVLDKETQVVWEGSPATTTHTWTDARGFCANKNVGGRKGWRLPSVHELRSLVDPNTTTFPFLPAGHPFNVEPSHYWAATTSVADSTRAWEVDLVFTGRAFNTLLKTNGLKVWCVRGGLLGPDVY